MRPGVEPRSIRLMCRLYRWATLLLPPDFRSSLLAEGGRDLLQLLREAHKERGPEAVLRQGGAALADVLAAAPREWRAQSMRNTNSTGGGGMADRLNELKVAARALAKRPGYAAAAVITLALGMGSTVAIFTIVNAVVLQPLPYADANRLVTIRHHAPGLDLPDLSNSPGTIRVYREEADFLQAMAPYGRASMNLTGGAAPERVRAVSAAPSLFSVLGVAPSLGRPFNDADATEGPALATILSHRFWTSNFGGDPSVIGRSVTLDGSPVEVVGVAPAGFAFPNPDVDLYVPMWVDPLGDFGAFGTQMVARLAPTISVEAAQARTDDLNARFPDFFEGIESLLDQAGWSATVVPYKDFIVGPDVASTLWLLLGTVGVVLLIACANVANLFLVRSDGRQKEIAVRRAMGARPGHIARSFLAESVVLGVAGGILGVALAAFGISLLAAHGPEELPRLHEVRFGASALILAGALAMGVAVVLGSVPALASRRSTPAGILRDGERGSTVGRSRQRGRNTLVAGQLALALVLLVGSGLMLRSFAALRGVDAGIDGTGVTVVGLRVSDTPSDEAARFFQQVAEEVATLPGIASVGLSGHVPIGGGNNNGGSFYIESRPRDEGDLPPVAMYKPIGADYLDALRQPLRAGRALRRSDWETGTPVLLVNETFSRQHFDGNAIGERIKWDESVQFAEIVGVVGNVREFGLQEEAGPVAYLPMVVGDWSYPNLEGMYLFARADGDRTVPVPAIREIVRRLNPDVPVTSVRTMDEVMAGGMAATSFTMLLLGIASGIALFLGAVGLFGVVSYVVGQRTREIGVRVALGAESSEIQGMVLRQGGKVALGGVLLGMAGAVALSRVMASLLYGVSTKDPLAFGLAPAVLLLVAGLATWLPARRAARVDPLVALRSE